MFPSDQDLLLSRLYFLHPLFEEDQEWSQNSIAAPPPPEIDTNLVSPQ